MVTLMHLGPDHVAATFRFPASVWAEDVRLLGDFSQGNEGIPMRFSPRDEEWQTTVILEANKTYRYCFMVDDAQRYPKQDTISVVGQP